MFQLAYLCLLIGEPSLGLQQLRLKESDLFIDILSVMEVV